jgi:protein O-GlcNAc transferase
VRKKLSAAQYPQTDNNPSFKHDKNAVGDGKLKIGYLSGDFNEHAISYLIAGLFESHDKSRF